MLFMMHGLKDGRLIIRRFNARGARKGSEGHNGIGANGSPL